MSWQPIQLYQDPYSKFGAKEQAKPIAKSKGKYKTRISFLELGATILPNDPGALHLCKLAIKLLSVERRSGDTGIPKLNFIERMFYPPLYVQSGNNPPVWVLVNKSSLRKRFHIEKPIFKAKLKQFKNLEERQVFLQEVVQKQINRIVHACKNRQ